MSTTQTQSLCRPLFFDGQRLSAKHLTRGQDYLLERLRRHNRYLRGWGVVCGAWVEQAGGASQPLLVTVSEGYAILPSGDELYIPAGMTLDLSDVVAECLPGRGCEDLSSEPPPQTSIDFSAFPIQLRPNPWEVAGVEFEAFQFDGTSAGQTLITSVGIHIGLALNSRLRIRLPRPITSVDLNLVHFSSPASASIIRDGAIFETVRMSDDGFAPEVLNLASSAAFTELQLIAPGNPALLLNLSWMQQSSSDSTSCIYVIAEMQEHDSCLEPAAVTRCDPPGGQYEPTARCEGVALRALCELPDTHQVRQPDCGKLRRLICGEDDSDMSDDDPVACDVPVAHDHNYVVLAAVKVQKADVNQPQSRIEQIDNTTLRRRVLSDAVVQDYLRCLCDTPRSNQPPQVSLSRGDLVYQAGDGAVQLINGISITDDQDTLASAQVRITQNYLQGAEVLGFDDQGGIQGLWDAATGTLTLSGAATAQAYALAIQSVRYEHKEPNADTPPRTVSVTINDGQLNSLPANVQITYEAAGPMIEVIEDFESPNYSNSQRIGQDIELASAQDDRLPDEINPSSPWLYFGLATPDDVGRLTPAFDFTEKAEEVIAGNRSGWLKADWSSQNSRRPTGSANFFAAARLRVEPGFLDNRTRLSVKIYSIPTSVTGSANVPAPRTTVQMAFGVIDKRRDRRNDITFLTNAKPLLAVNPSNPKRVQPIEFSFEKRDVFVAEGSSSDYNKAISDVNNVGFFFTQDRNQGFGEYRELIVFDDLGFVVDPASGPQRSTASPPVTPPPTTTQPPIVPPVTPSVTIPPFTRPVTIPPFTPPVAVPTAAPPVTLPPFTRPPIAGPDPGPIVNPNPIVDPGPIVGPSPIFNPGPIVSLTNRSAVSAEISRQLDAQQFDLEFGVSQPPTLINGIGDAFQKKLASAGVESLAQFAVMPAERAAEVLSVSEVRVAGMQDQARQLMKQQKQTAKKKNPQKTTSEKATTKKAAVKRATIKKKRAKKK